MLIEVSHTGSAPRTSRRSQGTLCLVVALGAMTVSAPVFAQASADPQKLVQPNFSTNGPPGTYKKNQTRRTLYANGVEVQTTRSFQKSQSYSSGNGELSATTSIKGSGPTTSVSVPVQNPQQEIAK